MQSIVALWLRNMREFVRDRTRLAFSIIFPFFFIYVFSSIFKNEFIENPITYMLAGIIIATVFDTALRVSSSTIDDMVSGFMKEVLVSPVSRVSVAFGQFLSSATVATVEGILVIGVGFFIGFRVTSPFTILFILLSMIFVGFVFSGFGLFLATSTKSTQTFQIVTMAITMPMTFISGAYIPLSLLPRTLQYVSYINPLTYAVILFRTIALERLGSTNSELLLEELAIQMGNVTVTPALSLVILFAFGILFLTLSTLAFVRTDFSRMSRRQSDAINW